MDAIGWMDKFLALDTKKKRIDSDTTLYHDFFWNDPMPSDLSKILSQHLQSIFEYLATPRRSGEARLYQQQMVPKPQDNSLIDRVFFRCFVRLFCDSSQALF